jgi:hypothetical protein
MSNSPDIQPDIKSGLVLLPTEDVQEEVSTKRNGKSKKFSDSIV